MDCGLVFFSFASTFGSISSQQIVRSIKSKKKKCVILLKFLQILNLKPIWNVFNHEKIFGLIKNVLAEQSYFSLDIQISP